MTKSMFQSSTIWGAIVMILPAVFSLIKIDIGTPEIEQGVSLIQQLVNGGMELVGFIMTIRGRFKASKPISVLGG